jgi:ribosomal protein S18 acetylase RimI-like enzyme
MSPTIVRRANKKDMRALGALGALLLRTHHDFDPLRFMMPSDDPEEGYGWFLGTQLQSKDVAVFVAERDGVVIGYVYAGIEPLSWKELRDECGFIHDVAVNESGRRTGVATALIEAAIGWLRERQMPRVVLWTAERNEAAQRLFAALGFRRTMIEMTRELD